MSEKFTKFYPLVDELLGNSSINLVQDALKTYKRPDQIIQFTFNYCQYLRENKFKRYPNYDFHGLRSAVEDIEANLKILKPRRSKSWLEAIDLVIQMEVEAYGISPTLRLTG